MLTLCHMPARLYGFQLEEKCRQLHATERSEMWSTARMVMSAPLASLLDARQSHHHRQLTSFCQTVPDQVGLQPRPCRYEDTRHQVCCQQRTPPRYLVSKYEGYGRRDRVGLRAHRPDESGSLVDDDEEWPKGCPGLEAYGHCDEQVDARLALGLVEHVSLDARVFRPDHGVRPEPVLFGDGWVVRKLTGVKADSCWREHIHLRTQCRYLDDECAACDDCCGEQPYP
ncbi:hypothetical protein V8E36_007625 [Tilletia maclaganii]